MFKIEQAHPMTDRGVARLRHWRVYSIHVQNSTGKAPSDVRCFCAQGRVSFSGGGDAATGVEGSVGSEHGVRGAIARVERGVGKRRRSAARSTGEGKDGHRVGHVALRPADGRQPKSVYDYLLVVGPGRSGSDFLYQLLRGHPSFVFPEIKERYYYRSPKAFRRAWKRLDGRGRGQLLCDVANLAYADAKLRRSVDALREEGFRILLVVLLRDHRDRAVSMMQFRRSRAELSALLGARRLETAVVRDRLTAEHLADVFRTNADVLTLSFSALTQDTGAVMDILRSLCGDRKFDRAPQQAANQAVGARSLWLSAFAHWCGLALRHFGFRRLLRRIKENEAANKAFFVPLADDAEKPHLSEESLKALDASAVACRRMVENSSRQVREGIHWRKAEQPDDVFSDC